MRDPSKKHLSHQPFSAIDLEKTMVEGEASDPPIGDRPEFISRDYYD